MTDTFPSSSSLQHLLETLKMETVLTSPLSQHSTTAQCRNPKEVHHLITAATKTCKLTIGKVQAA
jgi:hypothetical protein